MTVQACLLLTAEAAYLLAGLAAVAVLEVDSKVAVCRSSIPFLLDYY